eukprot:scaffold3103_cov136-Cylindrotheca_fusiformis.AAC.15
MSRAYPHSSPPAISNFSPKRGNAQEPATCYATISPWRGNGHRERLIFLRCGTKKQSNRHRQKEASSATDRAACCATVGRNSFPIASELVKIEQYVHQLSTTCCNALNQCKIVLFSSPWTLIQGVDLLEATNLRRMSFVVQNASEQFEWIIL